MRVLRANGRRIQNAEPGRHFAIALVCSFDNENVDPLSDVSESTILNISRLALLTFLAFYAADPQLTACARARLQKWGLLLHADSSFTGYQSIQALMSRSACIVILAVAEIFAATFYYVGRVRAGERRRRQSRQAWHDP